MSFTPEELEAMRLADEEIDREFEENYVADQVHKEMDAWLDELAIMDLLDHQSARRRKRQKKYSAAYYEAHREEIAAKQAAYREAHREEIAAKQAAYREANREKYNAYMREYQRARRRRKEKQIVQQLQTLAVEG